MWCERCPDRSDTASLGSDEHPHKEWGILCEQCVMELDIQKGVWETLQREAAERAGEPMRPRRQDWRRYGDVA